MILSYIRLYYFATIIVYFMVSVSDLRIGSVIKYNGKILKIKDKMHVKLAKGGACYQVSSEDILRGCNMEIRLNVKDSVEEIYIEAKQVQFMYTDNENIIFMDMTDCNMIEVDKKQINNATLLSLLENYESTNQELAMTSTDPISILLQFIDTDGVEKCIGCELTNDITVVITETNPSIKGESATSSSKPAIACGLHIKVPPHVNVGDKVLLSKSTLEYVRKVL